MNVATNGRAPIAIHVRVTGTPTPIAELVQATGPVRLQIAIHVRDTAPRGIVSAPAQITYHSRIARIAGRVRTRITRQLLVPVIFIRGTTLVGPMRMPVARWDSGFLRRKKP